MFFINILN